jgi:hypothetical protein
MLCYGRLFYFLDIHGYFTDPRPLFVQISLIKSPLYFIKRIATELNDSSPKLTLTDGVTLCLLRPRPNAHGQTPCTLRWENSSSAGYKLIRAI